jgi:hypothetical protein
VEIFDFYTGEDQETRREVEAWQSLVHVCHRWRIIVFGSSRRLNLRLHCDAVTRVRSLNVWPPLPLFIQESRYYEGPEDADNVVFALKQNHRVCKIDLTVVSPELENVWVAMQEPFPELVNLAINTFFKTDDIPDQVPDSFLGGSAQRLRHLQLGGIPFPGLLRLLLSTTHLVTLCLWRIPQPGYISPEAMISGLSVLTSLEEFTLMYHQFESPDQENQCPSLPACPVLPALTTFHFQGVTDYLEDLVGQIDAPRLSLLSITFFDDQVINFDNQSLVQFISCTPSFETPKNAHFVFNDWVARVKLSSQTSGYGSLDVGIDSTRQLTCLAQVCNSSLPPVSTVEKLCISETRIFEPRWDLNVVGAIWLELFHPFVSVKNLYVYRECVPRIAFALQKLLERGTTEELPVLQNLFLEEIRPGPVQEVIEDFVASRKLSGNPITVTARDRNSEQDSF